MFNFLLEGEAASNAGGGWFTWVSLGLLVVVFYFLIIRPQRKQEKDAAAMRNALEVGDEITTIGGIIGKIISIKEETLMIETGHDRTKIRILKSAVRNVDVHAADAVLPNTTGNETKKESK
jgi:preprotein translocase subunit YajC